MKPKKPEEKKIVISQKKEEIEISITHIITRYDLNWFYMRKKIMYIPNKIKNGYMRYSNWWNRVINHA